jgi:hypothetical protein
MIKVHFHTYCGEAGDLQEMLVARTEQGHYESRLFYRFGPFASWNLMRAKRKLMERIELITGQKAVEAFNDEPKYSLDELRHIAVNFAINCEKGYKGDFDSWFNGISSDWRKIANKI